MIELLALTLYFYIVVIKNKWIKCITDILKEIYIYIVLKIIL